MSNRGRLSDRILGFQRAANRLQRDRRFARAARRDCPGDRIALGLVHLETRTMLSVSAIVGPLPSLSAPAPVQGRRSRPDLVLFAMISLQQCHDGSPTAPTGYLGDPHT
jgi:hypothetical protein